MSSLAERRADLKRRPLLTTELREFTADRTAREIAALIGRCPNVVRHEARRRGVPIKRSQRGFPLELRERAAELRAQGLSYVKIGAALGISQRTAHSWMTPVRQRLVSGGRSQ